jgi:hypothetical protein
MPTDEQVELSIKLSGTEIDLFRQAITKGATQADALAAKRAERHSLGVSVSEAARILGVSHKYVQDRRHLVSLAQSEINAATGAERAMVTWCPVRTL